MGCDATALVCAVRDLNETLQAGPSWFDWLALLVVPLFVGLVTLAVAAASLRVARQSNALAKQVRQDGLDREQRREREEFVAEIPELIAVWEAYTEWPIPRRAEDVGRVASRLDAYSRALSSPQATELVLLIEQIMQNPSGESLTKADIAARRNAAEFYSRQWLLDPKAWTTVEEAQQLHTTAMADRLPKALDEES